MSSHLEAPAEARQPPLGKTALVARLTLIGVILAAALGTFAYLGGWLTPNVLTPARFVDVFEEVNGVHPGFRRNHAKGVDVSGFFKSNGNGVRLSKAVVFQPRQVPVIGRFSLGGGQPYAADTPDAVRGLGLQFSLPDGEVWRTWSNIHRNLMRQKEPATSQARCAYGEGGMLTSAWKLGG